MSIKIKKYEIQDTKISKELSGYRIALFSDTHDVFSSENVHLLLDAFEKIKPDVLLFAGDGVNAIEKSPYPLIKFENTLSAFEIIASHYKLYYITGNHEKRIEKNSCLTHNGDYEKIISFFNEHNINFLSNESTVIADGKITLYGLDLTLEYYLKKYKKLYASDIESLIGQANKDTYNILLSHTPIFFKEYTSWGADLTLSGHMHGGLVRLPLIGGVLSPYRSFFPKYDYGLFENEKGKMIITSGVGDHNMREKISNPLEVCEIVLKSKEQS